MKSNEKHHETMEMMSNSTPTQQATQTLTRLIPMQWTWKGKHHDWYGDGVTNPRVSAPVEATVALLKDMGQGKLKEYKKIWGAARLGFRQLAYRKEGNRKGRNIYLSFSCGKCAFPWCTVSHMYVEELPQEYPVWLAK